ncbi:hypothetical protein JHK84_045185 [Glycine max]|nr:hypothetical protein JHK86_045126 [Glycine max]KAG5108278.1 hypothetical protein JHK84_045185 [Glycine max]
MHFEAEALEHTKKRDTGHQSVSLENKTGDSTVLKIGDSAKVVIKQNMKGRKHKYGFNNNKREKTEKKRVVDDETGDKHELNQSRQQRNLMYLAAITDSQPQPSPLASQEPEEGFQTLYASVAASKILESLVKTDEETLVATLVMVRKRKKKGNYSDDVDSNSVENVVAMWERRLSLKLLLAALNGKDSAVATCRFCRLMGTTTAELLLNR